MRSGGRLQRSVGCRTRMAEGTRPLGSAELARRRREYQRTLARALREVVAWLRAKPEVSLIVLFGSYGAGRRDLFTDLDLLVVMESDQDFVRRVAALYRELPMGVDLDLLAFTPEEFERMRARGFVREALRTGRILYERGPA